MTPRLISLSDAKAYLGGRHPVSLGIAPVVRGLWDKHAIDAWLDQKLPVKVDSPPPAGPANDTDDEQEALERRIADASGRP